MTVSQLVEYYRMLPHPEGGYYSEVHRDERQVTAEGFDGMRSASTSIFFLLERGQFSALHRIKSDEVWHFYEGDPLEIWEIDQSGSLKCTRLGNNPKNGENRVYVVKAGNWFGSRPAPESAFSLVGCSVAPGFDFQDFEMPSQEWFLKQYPHHQSQIRELTRVANQGFSS